MRLTINATVGERIKFYRLLAGLTQKELAERCEISESAIRNYELGNRVPDFDTMAIIADCLRVNAYAIIGADMSAMDGALQALYVMEIFYGLHPVDVDGQIHFVFLDSVPLDDLKNNVDACMQSSTAMFQKKVSGYMNASALYQAGKLDYEDYEYWKSKYPQYLNDFRDYMENKKQGRTSKTKEKEPDSSESKKTIKRKRIRKVNNGSVCLTNTSPQTFPSNADEDL